MKKDWNALYLKWLETRDDKEFAELYYGLENYLWGIAWRYKYNLFRDELEEIVSTTLTKMITLAPTHYDKTKSKIGTWLGTCLINDIRQLAKQKKITKSFTDIEAMNKDWYHDYADKKTSYDHSIDTLAKFVDDCSVELPPVYKEAYDFTKNDLTYLQGSKELGLTEQGLKSRVFVARKLLRKIVQDKLLTNPLGNENAKELL